MPWDRGYYYRAQRINGRPTRVYVGGGRLGQMAAAQDAAERARRADQADALRRQRAADRAANRDIDAEYRRLRTWTAALLTAAGYYQHHRGEWRKMDLKAFARRYREAEERDALAAAGKLAAAGAAGKLPAVVQQAGPADSAERAQLARDAEQALHALVKRVNGPTPSRADLDALRDVLAQPWNFGGAVLTVLDGAAIRDAIISSCAGSESSRLIMRADADRLAKSLGRDAAPPFERPLIDHIVTCWVRLQLVERDLTATTAGRHSMPEGAYRDRRLSEAQRRYLRALNLLAKLRHLGPAVQLNIAGQQVVLNGPKGE